MESAARALLRRLGAGVRPTESPHARTSVPIEGLPFDRLVGMARAGVIGSGQGMDHAPGVDRLDRETVARLSAVTDAAHAAGFARIGALLTGDDETPERVVTIAVGAREIVEVSDDVDGRFVAGADAFVRVPRVEEQELRTLLSEREGAERRSMPGSPLLGATPLRNASLARVLAENG